MICLLPQFAEAQPTDAQFLTGEYFGVLGRPPDATGWAYWYQYHPFLGSQLTRDQLSTSFLGTAEYCNYFGQTAGCTTTPSDGQFLTLLFNRALGRPPDSAGFNYWLYCILEPGSSCLTPPPASTALTRAQVTSDFLNGP